KPTGSLGKIAIERPSLAPPKETMKPKSSARLSADADRVALDGNFAPQSMTARPPAPPTTEDQNGAWSASRGAVIGFGLLALVAFALAMRIQRREAQQSERAGDR